MPSMSQVVAGIAFLAVAGSWSWAFLADISVEDPGKPRIKAEPVARLEASLPVIGPFPSFNVNKENPFIPSQFREKERKVNDSRPTGTKPPPPTPVVEKPPCRPWRRKGPPCPLCWASRSSRGRSPS